MARYVDAVYWIAANDGDVDMLIRNDGDERGNAREGIRGLIHVLLVADVWRKQPDEVAIDIQREWRRQQRRTIDNMREEN